MLTRWSSSEVAKAGFADELLKIAPEDEAALQEWRDWLKHELETNEGGYFGRRHKSILIPKDFPQKEILALYVNPVVSAKEPLQNLFASLNWDKPIDIPGLRRFVADAFGWSNLSGAKKFIRTIAPKLIAYRLCKMSEGGFNDSDDLTRQGRQEATLVKAICGQRHHVVADGQSELRIAYIPADIVDLDLEQEEDGDDASRDNVTSGPACHDSDSENPELPATPSKSRSRTRYDPGEQEKIWILESFVKLGVPLMWETWKEEQREPRMFATRKAREKKALAKGGMKPGALDAFVKVSKAGVLRHPLNDVLGPSSKGIDQGRPAKPTQKAEAWRATNSAGSSTRDERTKVGRKCQASTNKLISNDSTKAHQVAPSNDLIVSSKTRLTINPWTLAKRPSDTFDIEIPPGTRYSALGIYPSEVEGGTGTETLGEQQIEEAPLVDLSPPTTPQKHDRPLSASSIDRNITVRRKKKNKTLTRTYTAPSGTNDVVDLIRPEQNPRLKCTDRPDPDVPHPHNEDPVLRTTRAFHMQGSEENVLDGLEAYIHHKSGEAQKVGQRLDFGIEASLLETSPTSVNSLLSCPAPLFQSQEKDSDRSKADVAFLSTSPSPTKGRRRTGRLIMLRDSLEGKWRDAEPSDRRRGPTRVFSSVGVVDLTSPP
ncbi:MAG: hypothetical protein Q9191_001397 [Dirinaria sp. TL-2023a]